MRESISPVRVRCLLIAVAGMIALSPVSLAQQHQVGVGKELETNWRNTYKECREYMQGKKVEDKKAAEKIAQACARYHIYRITHGTPEVSKVQKDFADIIAHSKYAEFNNVLGPQLVEAMKEALGAQTDPKKDAVIIVNAAIMLPAMAKLKQDDVGNYLVELVNAKDTNDVVRLYALKGLKEYMPITVQKGFNGPNVPLDLKSKTQNEKRAKDRKYVEALTKYIEDSFKIGGLTRGEIEGVRYLRREAIIALAHAGSPAVLAVPEKDGKKKTPDGMVAPTLLKVLVKGELLPPPSLQEKIEAAVGLLNMNYKDMPEYNPEVATYLVGKMLVEFANEYNKDLTNFTAAKKASYLPWKDDARHLKDAIIENTKKNPDSQSARELRMRAEPVLQLIIEYKTPNVNELAENVEKWRPKTGKVLKTLAAPEIRFAPAVDPD